MLIHGTSTSIRLVRDNVTMIKLEDLEMAFDFVSAGAPYDHSAYVSRTTGEIYYESDLADVSELPEEGYEELDLVQIPHKNDLDLGRELVFRFADARGSDFGDRVRDIFRRRGAYGRFKDLLDRRGLLEDWYEFEARESRARLLEWCKEASLIVEE